MLAESGPAGGASVSGGAGGPLTGGTVTGSTTAGGTPDSEKDGIVAVPREVLASVTGDAESAALIDRARQDLRQRVGLLLDEELLRFGAAIDSAGQVDAVAAVRLHQAEYSLEAAR